MDGAAPLELTLLLHAPDAVRREAAWEELIARHTRLILAAARRLGGDRDDTMERYAYVLEKLRENDFRRLRAFRQDGRATFSTWLTIATRRLCLDHHRSRYGRARDTDDAEAAIALRRFRRRLAESIGAGSDVESLTDVDALPADDGILRRERTAALLEALATLSAEDRLLLTYRFEDDLTAARIASLTGAPTAFHVFRRLRRVLAQLRAALEARGIDDDGD
jgi:RNA polymerase sigma factor (sigma-70 family)